jgi:hypothetical protein
MPNPLIGTGNSSLTLDEHRFLKSTNSTPATKTPHYHVPTRPYLGKPQRNYGRQKIYLQSVDQKV